MASFAHASASARSPANHASRDSHRTFRPTARVTPSRVQSASASRRGLACGADVAGHVVLVGAALEEVRLSRRRPADRGGRARGDSARRPDDAPPASRPAGPRPARTRRSRRRRRRPPRDGRCARGQARSVLVCEQRLQHETMVVVRARRRQRARHCDAGQLVPERRRPAARSSAARPRRIARWRRAGGSSAASRRLNSAREGTIDTKSTTARVIGAEARAACQHGVAHGDRYGLVPRRRAPRSRKTDSRRSRAWSARGITRASRELCRRRRATAAAAGSGASCRAANRRGRDESRGRDPPHRRAT